MTNDSRGETFHNPEHAHGNLALAVDMSQMNFNREYLASSPQLVQGSVAFDLPNLTLISDTSRKSGQPLCPPKEASHGGTDVKGGGGQPVDQHQFKFTHKVNQDGSYTEQHFGPRPEDNYVLSKNVEGQYFVAAKPGDAPEYLGRWSATDIRLSRAELNERADKHITDPAERQAFADNMRKFEERSKQLEDIYHKEGMSDADAAKKAREEISKTYFRISQLLNTVDNPSTPLHERERVAIAQQILAHAAEPTSIDQGRHMTCNVTTIEARTYTREPSTAANLVYSVASNGFYMAKDRTRYAVDQDSLKPDKDSELAFGANADHQHALRNDGARDLASQVFQVTAVNIWYQKHDPSIRYEQTADGERLFRYSGSDKTEVSKRSWSEFFGGKDATPVRFPDLSDSALVELGNALTGSNAQDWFFEHASDSSSAKNTVKIHNEKELETKLADAKANGVLPIVIVVYTGNEPFYSDGGKDGDGGHVVCVTDYEAGPPAKVAIDNQWGSGADHLGQREISARQLYLAMRKSDDSDQLHEFEDFVRADRSKGLVNVDNELEMLRLEKKSGSDDAYIKGRVESLIATGANQFGNEERERKGQIDIDALGARLAKFKDVVDLLPADTQMMLISQILDRYTDSATDKTRFTGNTGLGVWAANVDHNAWAEHLKEQHEGRLNTENLDRTQRVQKFYTQIQNKMSAPVADSMREIIAKQP